jgi:surfactin synthase thioesterase subunit
MLERGLNRRWIAENDLRPAAKMRLFCLPHAGSGIALYYRWKRVLTGIDVCPVMLPGREMRLGEALIENAGALIDELMEATRSLLDVPYSIFGHSMGSLLAYEWARAIQAAGLDAPRRLFVSGRNAPHLPLTHRELHRLGDAEFVEELQRRYGGVPENFLEDAELRELFLPVLRADLKLVETYEHAPGERLDCPVRAWAGQEDDSVSEPGLAGWAEWTRGGFAMRRFAGDHFYLMGSEQDAVLDAVASELMPGAAIRLD